MDNAPMSENAELLEDFAAYCRANPTQRFWQALRNWSDHNFILVAPHLPTKMEADYHDLHDTYYWRGKTAPPQTES